MVRVITPGTLIEDGLLPARANNFLAAAIVERGGAGLAFVDVSTGHLAATEVRGRRPARCWPPSWSGSGRPSAWCRARTSTATAEALAELLPPGARATPAPALVVRAAPGG